MYLSLLRIGWAMPNFAQLQSDLGTSYSLTTTSPKLVKMLLREGVLRQLCRLSGKKLGVDSRLCYDSAIRDLRSSKFTAYEKGAIRANVASDPKSVVSRAAHSSLPAGNT